MTTQPARPDTWPSSGGIRGPFSHPGPPLVKRGQKNPAKKLAIHPRYGVYFVRLCLRALRFTVVPMEAAEVQKIVCRQCFAVLDVGDNYCRHCGTPTADGGGMPPRPSPPSPIAGGGVKRPKGSESPWVVLLMLFVVLGPLALPMLWGNRHFSPVWKIVLTVVMVFVTGLVIFLAWYVVAKALEPLEQLKSLKGF